MDIEVVGVTGEVIATAHSKVGDSTAYAYARKSGVAMGVRYIIEDMESPIKEFPEGDVRINKGERIDINAVAGYFVSVNFT